MTAGVLVIGLDGAESTVLEKWADQGYLPNIAKLSKEGSVRKLTTPETTLPGAIWPEITSGRSGSKTNHFCTVNQIPLGETRYRPVQPKDLDINIDYWNIASKYGKRVAAIDQVQCALNRDINGIQISEWGCHDRNFSTHSEPPELLDELNLRYGSHPVDSCDTYDKSFEGYTLLLEDLIEGTKRKTSMLLDLLNRERWDLFTCSYSESHCAGHQMWHLHDETHLDHPRDAPEHLKHALRSVYSAIDEGIGKIIRANDVNATTLVFASHGMGPFIGGYQMIPEILSRLGMSSDGGKASSSMIRSMQNKIKHHIPYRWVPFLEHHLPNVPILRGLQERFGGLVFPLDSHRTRASFVPNNRVGGIRLNIKGREPNGCLCGEEEISIVINELKSELLALRHIESGEPLVDKVSTSEELFGKDRHPGIPDLMVQFNNRVGCLESCESERIGKVRIPAQNIRMSRSGDHTPEARLWILGGKDPAGMEMPEANVLDIAPEILKLLDIPVSPEIDGESLTN
jgi:predicted AlkP superfamily phosphohydrolase/phosphomutase